ncbi:MAG: hypothetical protein U0263_41870, partial [Polyangiaceae bacterium]
MQVLFAALTFFGALLLFGVQPMLAKWLLPEVGGSPATWAVCMLFYQVLLLGGYAYAHLSSGRLGPRTGIRAHLALVVAAALALVLAARGGRVELGSMLPAVAIPWLLLRRIGLPFFVLSTTTPLIQRWAAGVSERSPYRLYALSNAGSLVGLLGYPFLLEPALGLEAQRTLWAGAFWLYALGLVSAGVWVLRTTPVTAPPQPLRSDAGARPGSPARWLACAFVPSVMLLSATNHITVDVAAVPLLWVVPLALYLCTFIVAFSVWRDAWRAPVLALWIVAAVGMGWNAFAQARAPLWSQLGATLLALTSSGLLCHGELARSRPASAELTRFYVWVATGGALGGVFVGWLA